MTRINSNKTPFYNFLTAPKFRVWRHLCFFLAIVLISFNYAFPINNLRVFHNPLFWFFLITMILTYIVTSYFNFYYLIPRYLLRKKYLPYLGYLSLSILLLLIAQYKLENYFTPKLGTNFNPLYDLNNGIVLTINILSNFFINFIAFIGCSVTILLKHWMTENQLVNQLERQYLQTEVEHLKEQVNPDFLFHSLDRIAALEEEDATQATAMLMNLSRLLRYQLYDSSHQQVFLTSEIQYLTNYLNLVQLYHGNMQYTISANGEVNHILLPPLLFIPFVQYIVSQTHSNIAQTHVSLNFESDDNYIYFTCHSDTYKDLQNPNSNDLIFRSIKQRIYLLFHTNYKLEIQPVPGKSCTISLQLKL